MLAEISKVLCFALFIVTYFDFSPIESILLNHLNATKFIGRTALTLVRGLQTAAWAMESFHCHLTALVVLALPAQPRTTAPSLRPICASAKSLD